MIYETQDTIVGIAQQRAIEHPERTHVKFLRDGESDEVDLSYGELDQSARKVAAWMQHKGVDKGDRVLIMLPNGLEFVQVLYGCLYSACVPVPLPHQMHAYRESLLPTLIATKPKVLIATAQVINFFRNKLPSDLKKYFSSLKLISPEDLMRCAQLYRPVAIKADDVAYLQFSSGSTGAPKGVMVGHSNIMANMEEARLSSKWEEGAGTVLWLTLFHDFGLAAGMLGSMYHGGYIILMTTVHFVLKPHRWLMNLDKYKCSYSYAPPFAFDACVRSISDAEKKSLDLSSWVSVVIGAEPVHYTAVQIFNEFFAECGLKPDVVRPGFGMAETVIMFSVSKQLSALCVDRHLLEIEGQLKLVKENTLKEDKKYLVNLGSHMNGHEIAIKGSNGEKLPEGKVGEVMITGPSVCMGYYENEEQTQKTFRNQFEGDSRNYLGTGDLGLMWEGDLYFSGRIKDLIIIRGRNYYPHDIEFVVPRLDEVCHEGVMAYSILGNETAEQLVLAIEIEAALTKDMDAFCAELLPQIDDKVIQIIGEHFQIIPAKRLYLKPGTIKKTSSGKIKHQLNKDIFEEEDNFKGLIACLTGKKELPKTDNLSIRETVIQLFKSLTKQEPEMDSPLVDLGIDSMVFLELLDAIEEEYPDSDQDLFDAFDESTTLQALINWLEEQQTHT